MPGITFTPTVAVVGLPASGSTTDGASNALMRPALPLCPNVNGRPHARFQASPRLMKRSHGRRATAKTLPALRTVAEDGEINPLMPKRHEQVVRTIDRLTCRPQILQTASDIGRGFPRGESSRNPGDHPVGMAGSGWLGRVGTTRTRQEGPATTGRLGRVRRARPRRADSATTREPGHDRRTRPRHESPATTGGLGHNTRALPRQADSATTREPGHDRRTRPQHESPATTGHPGRLRTAPPPPPRRSARC